MTAGPESIKSFFRNGLKPDRVLTVSDWADQYRYLSSRASAEPGKWSTNRTPYLREPMDVLSGTNPIEKVVFKKGSQVGGTEMGNNWIGYIIDCCPAPVMAVLPTVPLAKRNSKQRIEPLIDECPTLKKKIGNKSARDSSNNLLEKEFPGGILILTGANSASGLKSTPARFLFMDEIDEYPPDLEGQGDPISLALARSRTFSKRKVFLCGTPTVEGSSAIQAEFEETNQKHYYVPCPDCNEPQKLEFKNLKWNTERLPSGKKKVSNVHYICIKCKYQIKNWQKTIMLKGGHWIAENDDKSNGKVVGYFINALYSPVGWYSWDELAQDFIDCGENTEKLKTFVNTVLGETWKEKTETPEWRILYDRRESYPMREVPNDVCFLTAGVDVQADRLEVEIVGWARRKISYSIDYRVLTGDVSKPETWDQLTKILSERFPKKDRPNILMGIKMMAVDSGFKTQTVYDWVRGFSANRVVAVKGKDSLNLIHGTPSKSDVNLKGKVIRRGLRVWPVGVSVIKTELYGWLKQTKPIGEERIPFGYCHFPEYDPEFFKMLTAESLVVKYVKGFKVYEWKKNRERNEALDCRVYARAAASICGIDRFTEDNWAALESNFETITENKQTPTPKKKKKRESGFW